MHVPSDKFWQFVIENWQIDATWDVFKPELRFEYFGINIVLDGPYRLPEFIYVRQNKT